MQFSSYIVSFLPSFNHFNIVILLNHKVNNMGLNVLAAFKYNLGLWLPNSLFELIRMISLMLDNNPTSVKGIPREGNPHPQWSTPVLNFCFLFMCLFRLLLYYDGIEHIYHMVVVIRINSHTANIGSSLTHRQTFTVYVRFPNLLISLIGKHIERYFPNFKILASCQCFIALSAPRSAGML